MKNPASFSFSFSSRCKQTFALFLVFGEKIHEYRMCRGLLYALSYDIINFFYRSHIRVALVLQNRRYRPNVCLQRRRQIFDFLRVFGETIHEIVKQNNKICVYFFALFRDTGETGRMSVCGITNMGYWLEVDC